MIEHIEERILRTLAQKVLDIIHYQHINPHIVSHELGQIVMLCQVAGYKRREVAQMLDMPIGTVTWKNNEALKKLKQTLKEEENER